MCFLNMSNGTAPKLKVFFLGPCLIPHAGLVKIGHVVLSLSCLQTTNAYLHCTKLTCRVAATYPVVPKGGAVSPLQVCCCGCLGNQMTGNAFVGNTVCKLSSVFKLKKTNHVRYRHRQRRPKTKGRVLHFSGRWTLVLPQREI